jgi:hypothetical protein
VIRANIVLDMETKNLRTPVPRVGIARGAVTHLMVIHVKRDSFALKDLTT